jgi:hypothetical protein
MGYLNYWWLSISPLTYNTKYSIPYELLKHLNNPLSCTFEGCFTDMAY